MTEKKKMYRFVSSGSMTIILVGTKRVPQKDSAGFPIDDKIIPAKKAIFDKCYWETDDKILVDILMSKPEHWENDVFWHPTSMPEDTPKEKKAISDRLIRSKVSRAQRRQRGRDNALEGGVARE